MGGVATSEKPNGNSQHVVCATEEVEQSNTFQQGRHSGIIKLEMISAVLVPANRKVSRDPDLDDAPPRNLKIVCIGLAFPRSAEV